jgi:hypothetical protein
MHLLPFFGDWPLVEIDVQAVDAYRHHKVSEGEARQRAIERRKPLRDEQNRVLKPLAPSTINKSIDILQWVLSVALEYKYIAENPAVGRRRRLKEWPSGTHWSMPARSDRPGGEPNSSRENELLGGAGDMPEVDADAIYREIGLYVVLFQSLQDILLQICWLLAEPAYDPDDRKPLSRMTFHQLVSETGRRVHTFLISTGRGESEFGFEFAVRFHALLGRCRAIGRERNRVVHSGFIHLESFDRLRGIVMSDMRPSPDRAISPPE